MYKLYLQKNGETRLIVRSFHNLDTFSLWWFYNGYSILSNYKINEDNTCKEILDIIKGVKL